MNNESEFIVTQEYKSVLAMTPEFLFYFTHDKPNWWWRFWQYVFFGFKWKDAS